MAKIKIGNREFELKPLSMKDVKLLDQEKKKLKEDDDMAKYDYTFYALLYAIKKFNPEMKDLMLDDFEEMIGVDVFEEILEKMLEITGLKKYFKSGDSKKL